MRISRKKRPEKALIPHFNTNERIRVPEVRVLDIEGNNIGVMPTEDALRQARKEELDLVEINPKANPPVVQIIDFTHFRYQKEKQIRKQKVKTHVCDIKGVRLSIRIGEHDMDIRVMQATKFLERGDKVKTEIILHGRENGRPDIAIDVNKKFFEKLAKSLEIKYEQEPTKQGSKITSIIVRK